MHFGQWVQERRAERGCDLRAFAALTGVDFGTISRIENARTQATLSTAVQICEGVGASLTDLLEALVGKYFPDLEQKPRFNERVMPTAGDIEAFLSFAQEDPHACFAWLAHLLNRMAILDGGANAKRGRREGESGLFVPEDIQKLLLDARLYRFELTYPEEFPATSIWHIFQEGGLLTYTDIGAYIKRIRHTKQVTLARLEDSVKISASMLSSFESGSIERIRLIDVLALDQQLAQEGKIVAMYWSVCRFTQRLVRQERGPMRNTVSSPLKEVEQSVQLITIFTTICRWLQVLNQDDPSWMDELHAQLHQVNVQSS